MKGKASLASETVNLSEGAFMFETCFPIAQNPVWKEGSTRKRIRKAILPSSCPHASNLNCGVLSLAGQVLLGEKAQGRKEKECGKEGSRREHETHPDPLILSHNFVGIRLNSLGTSLLVHWLRFCLPLKGVQVQPLVRELRSHMPCSQKSKRKPEAIL